MTARLGRVHVRRLWTPSAPDVRRLPSARIGTAQPTPSAPSDNESMVNPQSAPDADRVVMRRVDGSPSTSSSSTTKPVLAELVSMALRYEVGTSRPGDGATAIEAARQNPPDVVVLDVMLPDMSGLEVLRKLREQISGVPLLLHGEGLRGGPAVAACLAAPAAISVATAASPHTRAIPSVGPVRSGGFSGGGLLSSLTPHPDLIRLLATDADDFTWLPRLSVPTTRRGTSLPSARL